MVTLKSTLFWTGFGLQILLQLSTLVTGTSLDFRLIPSIVQPLVTTNVTLQCTVDQIDGNYGSYNYRYSGRQRGDTIIARLRILKNFQLSWKPIAQLSDINPTDVQTSDSSLESADGLIVGNDVTRKSFIRVSWSEATSDTFGKYRCDVITFDQNQNTVGKTSRELEIGESLKAQDLLTLLNHEKNAIVDRLGKVEMDLDLNTNETDILQFDATELEKTTMEKMANLENRVGEQFEKLELLVQKLNETLLQSEQALETSIGEVGHKIELAFGSGFLMLWPRGTYGLLQPVSGCPSKENVQWHTGWRRHHTESTNRNRDEVSLVSHMKDPVLSRHGSNNMMTQHFCMKTEERTVGPTWPPGSYCINKKGACPREFAMGSLKWDEEDTNKSNALHGHLPDGVYEADTVIFYCCRQDGDANQGIYLPSSDPFYLYRLGGVCQKVYNMNVTEEYMKFDTENTTNKDLFTGVHPDGRINDIRLDLCYYMPV